MRLSRPGSLILADNTIRGGAVLDPQDGSARATREFNERVAGDPRLSGIVLPLIRERIDGITIARSCSRPTPNGVPGPPPAQRAPDPLRSPLQLLPAGPVRVIRAESQAEAVTLEAGYDVQVDVEDLLAGRLAVREEEVDPFALQSAAV